MALSDLQVYSEFAYEAYTEVLTQQVNLFNEATAGAITLQTATHLGDFSDDVIYGKVSGGTVRRRNAYGSGAVTEKTLAQKTDTSVKVAAGTPPLRIDPGQFRWIQRNPEEAGVVLGQQMAVDAMADMFNTAIGVGYAAMVQNTATVYDATGNTAPENGPSWQNLNNGQALFGDRSGLIAAWVMHSVTMHKLYGQNLANVASLFNFGTVNVVRDPFGKILAMTDSPNLVIAGSPNTYNVLGLVSGALNVDENNDFDANQETKNGNENIIRTYQAEWSYNVGVKGYSWDKANGGKSPNDAALFTSTNWDKYVASDKDGPGVLVKVR